MKLSEAISLGRMLIQHNNGTYTLYDKDGDGQCEGCAVGMALAAIGLTEGNHESLAKYWPWADTRVWYQISDWYFEVVRGQRTLDELIADVKVLEAQHEAPEAQNEVPIEVKFAKDKENANVQS